MKWISVKQKKPDNDHSVLVIKQYINNGVMHFCVTIDHYLERKDTFYCKRKWFQEQYPNKNEKKVKIIAWMDLPNIPREFIMSLPEPPQD